MITDFSTNRKLIYDFLSVINTNLPPILHLFKVMAYHWSNFRKRGGMPQFNDLLEVIPRHK